MRTLVLAAVMMVAGVLGAREARADGVFQVNPTRLDLGAAAATTALTVTNHGTSRLRLQLSVTGWTDAADGAMQLTPTTDLVVRPSLVVVEPGATRTVRVVAAVAAAARERSYRLFVEELPDRSAATGGMIRVVTRIGVPVFVAPAVATQSARVAVTAAGDRARVAVTATGSLHAKLLTVRVKTRAWSREIVGWYVLPAATRTFEVALGDARCAAGDALIAEVIDESGAAWSSEPRACEP